MINERLPGLFITGTDTDVGKTWITAAIARCLHESGYKVGVIKPLATGIKERFAEESDCSWLAGCNRNTCKKFPDICVAKSTCIRFC